MFRAESLELLARRRPRFPNRSANSQNGCRAPLLHDAEPADDPDDVIDLDDLGPRLSVILKESPVDDIYPAAAGPAPLLPAEMPSSFWTPLVLGDAGDPVSPEDAHLTLMLIAARLREYGIAGLRSNAILGQM